MVRKLPPLTLFTHCQSLSTSSILFSMVFIHTTIIIIIFSSIISITTQIQCYSCGNKPVLTSYNMVTNYFRYFRQAVMISLLPLFLRFPATPAPVCPPWVCLRVWGWRPRSVGGRGGGRGASPGRWGEEQLPPSVPARRTSAIFGLEEEVKWKLLGWLISCGQLLGCLYRNVRKINKY